MAKNRGDAAVADRSDGKAEQIAALKAENERLLARLVAQAGSGVAVPAKGRDEVLAGPHHWRWRGAGPLFLGKETALDGSCGIYRPGDIVSEEFALSEIAEGGASSKYLVPEEGEFEPNDPTPETSVNARLPRPQAHDRAVTKAAPAAPPTA